MSITSYALVPEVIFTINGHVYSLSLSFIFYIFDDIFDDIGYI
jgi:hypothetical protein